MLIVSLYFQMRVLRKLVVITQHQVCCLGDLKVPVALRECPASLILLSEVCRYTFQLAMEPDTSVERLGFTELPFQGHTRLNGKIIVEGKLQIMKTTDHGKFFTDPVFPAGKTLESGSASFV